MSARRPRALGKSLQTSKLARSCSGSKPATLSLTKSSFCDAAHSSGGCCLGEANGGITVVEGGVCCGVFISSGAKRKSACKLRKRGYLGLGTAKPGTNEVGWQGFFFACNFSEESTGSALPSHQSWVWVRPQLNPGSQGAFQHAHICRLVLLCLGTHCNTPATLIDITDMTLPDAMESLHNFHWLSLKPTHGRNSDPHHSPYAPIHYLTNLTNKLEKCMHKRHKLGFADTSGYYNKSWQSLNHAIQPAPPSITANT
eukprot:1159077-Pelagomonas_calceolata.AAC.5